VLRISDLFMSGTPRQNELFLVDKLLVLLVDIDVNNIVRIHKVIFYHVIMHRSNYLVHSISLSMDALRFYDGYPWVVNISHRSGAETLFAIVQVQYEEHALHTDSMELSNSSLYSTADTRYASLPSPHIGDHPVLLNNKNLSDHRYHSIQINVHYLLIIDKLTYFK
jgi:hypothetical protein